MTRWHRIARRWATLPPVMERTVRDDVKVALCVLAGATVGYFSFGVGHPSLLVGSLIGVPVSIVVLAVFRRVKHRRKA
jgi:hypothetical protein